MALKLSPLQKILLTFTLGIVFLLCFRPLSQSDDFYHLKVGQIIWETKSIPHSDIFSYTAGGTQWVTHEWLAELIFYAVFSAGGFWILIAFAALMSALTYGILAKFALERGANFYATCSTIFLAGFFTFQLWIPRPQIFSYLGFAILFIILEKYRREPKNRYLLMAVAEIWAWANLHASFILGIGLMLFYGIVLSLEKIFTCRTNQITKPSQKKSGGLFLFATIAALLALLNPNGYKIFIYMLTIQQNIKMFNFYEWLPITAYMQETEIKLVFFEIFSFAAITGWWFGIRKQSRDLIFLVLSIGMSLMPFLSVRHTGFWSLAIFAPLVFAISGIIKKYYPREAILPKMFIIAIIFLSIYGFFSLSRNYFDKDTIPVYAADFIQKNRLAGPLFNQINNGGYLIWRFWPKEKVFIDSRSEVYGKTQIRELAGITGNENEWRELTDKKYGINYFIFPYRPPLAGKSSFTLTKILVENNWPLVYWDDAVLIFVRPNETNKNIIDRYGLHHVNPFRDPQNIREDEYGAAVKELQKLIEISPASKIIRDYLLLLEQNNKSPL